MEMENQRASIVTAFVDELKRRLKSEDGVFQRVCQLAKDGKMGFGQAPEDYGGKNLTSG